MSRSKEPEAGGAEEGETERGGEGLGGELGEGKEREEREEGEAGLRGGAHGVGEDEAG